MQMKFAFGSGGFLLTREGCRWAPLGKVQEMGEGRVKAGVRRLNGSWCPEPCGMQVSAHAHRGTLDVCFPVVRVCCAAWLCDMLSERMCGLICGTPASVPLSCVRMALMTACLMNVLTHSAVQSAKHQMLPHVLGSNQGRGRGRWESGHVFAALPKPERNGGTQTWARKDSNTREVALATDALGARNGGAV